MRDTKEKKYFERFAAWIIAGVILTGGFIYCVDPFYHYHAPWFGLPPVMDNAVYQSPGEIRHFRYDSIILGTSMTENFHASWFDEMGWNTLKLSYSGARTDDLRVLLDYIFQSENTPDNVVMDLNTYQLTVPADSSLTERPVYLYDKSLLTDVFYLYNHDVLEEAIRRVIIYGICGEQYDADLAYTWEEESLFGRERVLKAAAIEKPGLVKNEDELSEMLRCCDENLDNLIPYIEAHPETHFYIYFPPYSILYWEQEQIREELDKILTVFAHSMQRLSAYKNVSLYYFQDEEEIILDLDHYRDVTHHRPEYNYYIYECIRDGRNLVTGETYQNRIEHLYRLVTTYDYEALWEDYDGG